MSSESIIFTVTVVADMAPRCKVASVNEAGVSVAVDWYALEDGQWVTTAGDNLGSWRDVADLLAIAQGYRPTI